MSEQHVAICIPTFRRPALLGQCLASIGRLQLPERLRVSVLVADNDVQKSALCAFQQAAADLPFDACYEVEPERGLSAIRNHLLERALACRATHVAFIDDDEIAHPLWLIKMISGLFQYQADVVCGPNISIENPAAAEFTPDPKRRSGSIARKVACNNVLFSHLLISPWNLRFDRYFDFIGGEDHDFFQRAKKLGAKAVWIADAPVFETITPARDTRRYRLYRHFSGGITSVLLHRKHHGYFAAWPHYLLKITGKCMDALGHLLLAPFTSPAENSNQCIIKLAYAAGCLCALFGLARIIVAPYRYE